MFGSSGMSSTKLPPDPAGSPCDDLELAALVVDAQRVAEHGGREAALRAEAEALEVDPLRRLAHARLELVLRLGPRALRRDEAEHDLRVVAHERERVEAAGALVVVLEEEPVGAHAAEDRRRDGVVAARDEPARVLV